MLRYPIGAIIQMILVIVWLLLLARFKETTMKDFHTLEDKNKKLLKQNIELLIVNIIIILI